MDKIIADIYNQILANGEYVVTKSFLIENQNFIFVFGDNLLRVGKGGAAKLRDCKNAYGFITKRNPSRADNAYYKSFEYKDVYTREIHNLKRMIKANPYKYFLVSKVGSGLANRFGVFEQVIEPNIKNDLAEFDNVIFLW